MYFDIGCHLGYWSIKNINNCNKIIAVEASPITFDFLKKNCNNDKITILNYAVCDNNLEDIDFYHAKNNLLL
jgi:FkbM family methyltransferase